MWLAATVIFLLGGGQIRGTERAEFDRPCFVILDADPRLAHQIDSVLNAAYAQLVTYGAVTITDTITLLVATRREQFDSVVGGRFPDWGLGCALPEHNTIVVLSPYMFAYQRTLPEVLRHELAHIYLHKLVGWPRIPRWMDEGFAMLLGHQWYFGDDWLVARVVFSRETVPLLQIEGLNLFKEAKARLAYTQSYLAMGFFLEKYGWDSFVLFLRELRSGNDWDRAFMAAAGLNYAGFQTEFTKYLENKYNWVALLSDTMLLWILLVLLVLVLYLFKRRMVKKKEQEWERAAGVEDIFYSAPDKMAEGQDNTQGGFHPPHME